MSIKKKEIVQVLKRTNNILFAYVFGSKAKNKTRLGSDLDIAVFFKEEPELLEIGKIVCELESETKNNIDLISLNNLYRKNPKLAYSVVAEGILLFCNNKNLLAQYKKNVFLYYLDFKPVIDLFTRKLDERILKKKFAVVEK
jgi:uncharacterized protein